MQLQSTRGAAPVSAPLAIRRGLADDGGLFAPASLPKLPPELYTATLPYAELSSRVLELFFEELGGLSELTAAAYARFDHPEAVPLTREPDGSLTLELYHGPTCAFKDVALQVLPGLLSKSRDMLGDTEKTCILTATSGDTGKAALEGFADAPDTGIIVFYPKEGVSPIQRRQMTTQSGGNVSVCAVQGNFDDAQSGVKRLFDDAVFSQALRERGWRLSSANSINIGRLVPQIVYYVSAYASALRQGIISPGDRLSYCVPTGNFGDILAGLYAKYMGLPVGRLICASNRNRILTDVLTTGVYDIKRGFYATGSPSMDILISSNFERALYLLSGNDPELVCGLMASLKNEGAYTLPAGLLTALREQFDAYSCGEDETLAEIRRSHAENGRLFDPHTAVGRACLRKHREATGDMAPTVTLATASPFKFPETMLAALGRSAAADGQALEALAGFSGEPAPARLSEVLDKTERFTQSVQPEDMKQAALAFIQAM